MSEPDNEIPAPDGPCPPARRRVEQPEQGMGGGLSKGRVVLSSIGLVLLLAAMSSPWLERHILVTDPVATDVRILRVEGTSRGDETQLTTFRYIVQLPDGSEARFASQVTFRVGPRLQASVWRSRLSGRVFVSGPYTASPE